jgi:hypothetical protein
MTEPVKLFISYRSLDATKVDTIVSNLSTLRADNGTQCYIIWQDKRNILASKRWWEDILDAIDNCDIFIFHISQEALKSEVCMAELDYAHHRNRFIISVVLEGEYFFNEKNGKPDITYMSLVPDYLKEHQFLFYDGSAFFEKFRQVTDDIRLNPQRAIPYPHPTSPYASKEAVSDLDLFNKAQDYAMSQAFDEARERFQTLVNGHNSDFKDYAYQWIDILDRYKELIKLDKNLNTQYIFVEKWRNYRKLFPKRFIKFFDPSQLAQRKKKAHQIPSIQGL